MATGGPPPGIPTSGGRPGGPPSAYGGGEAKPTKRQFVRFAFYKLDPKWRRLPEAEQIEQKRELAAVIESFNRTMLLRPYSLMGTRADVELLLWQITESLEPIQQFATAVASTRMGSYLNLAASYLSQTKRSIYEIRDSPDEDVERLIIVPSQAKYLFVYPFLKTRQWYKLPFEERQRMMDEHIKVGRKYASVKLNTTYSFGLDDQEFVLGFETDVAGDFLDLVQDLRETDASLFTLRDVPIYSCANMGLMEALDSLGGAKANLPLAQAPAKPKAQEQADLWTEACAVDDLADGARKVVYVNGQQLAVFNTAGKFYAISNRCPHARGPLSEGVVDTAACTVTCPWHYAKFSLETGALVDGVAASPVETHAVEIRDGKIFVSNHPSKQPA
jgi:chlorite dismutase/nitrite reductase/ring-hydroxylating ferredoxin subunit